MAISRSHFFPSTAALLLWLQTIDECGASRYDIDLPDMNYIASNMSPEECYDFYNLLSHRKAFRGEISIYALKEKAREIPCSSLLATWMTDPVESVYRSNENIELKLRAIGRKDLARWILRKIDSSLRRRELDNHENYRQIEESENKYPIVRNRTGNKIIPIPSPDDEIFIKNGEAEERHASCIFWKIFLSCLIILLLFVLVLCFYRFVYTKLRCICRRFDDTHDREYCLPEQTYGTTSFSECPANNHRKMKYTANLNDDYVTKEQEVTENMELLEDFSSSTELNDELLANFLEEKRARLLDSASRLMKENSQELPSMSKKIEPLVFSADSPKKISESNKFFVANCKEIPNSKLFLDAKSLSHGRIENSPKIRRWKSVTKEILESPKRLRRSRSENFLLTSLEKKIKRDRDRFRNHLETKKTKNFESTKWTSCSCNLMKKSPRSFLNNENEKSYKNNFQDIASSRESLTELSETYDELGMLFSQHLKRQSQLCRRKYCVITRNLRRDRFLYHDVKKCRNRRKINFGEKILISWDRRPACSSGNICKDTYDEYEIMRAGKDQRESLARSIIQRRRSFLNQPCLSPVMTQSYEELTNYDQR